MGPEDVYVCSGTVEHPEAYGGECGLWMDDIFVFIVGVTGCDAQIPDDGSNGICYHVPNGDNSMFNS